MKKRPLSASSIKTFLQCVLKYYYRYEDKKPRPGKTVPLAFGIAVHEALEYLHKKVAETGEAPSQELYEEVLKVYMNAATSNGLSDLEVCQEGRDMIISRLDGIDPNEKVIGLELQFNLKTPNGTPFTGSIDKLIELDPETVVIIDYKTSRFALSQSEADNDIQLSMYDLAVSLMYPQYKTIICALDYLRLSEVVTHRTPEQRQVFVEFLDSVYEQICSTEAEDVKANLNDFCPWCECKAFCPDYKSVIEDPDLVLPPSGELDDDSFVSSWEALNAAKRIIDARQRELKAEAYERMKTQNTIKGADKELYKTQQSRINYDTRTVFNIVGQEAFLKMSSVNKSAVDKFLRDNPQHSDAVENTASFSFASPSFRTRKVKEDN